MSIFALEFDDNNSIQHLIDELQATEQQVATASMRALNKTAMWLRTQATRQISKEVRIPQELIRERLRVLKADKRILQAKVSASMRGIKPQKVGSMRQTKRGARVGKHLFDGAFVVTMPKTGGRSIYKRKGTGRLPIRQMFIPIAKTGNKVVELLIDHKAMRRFEVVFERELNYITR